MFVSFTQGQEEIVELLLNYGLEIMVTNLYGETPLHIACRRGNIGESLSPRFFKKAKGIL